jgi:hypothetical protein
MRMYDRVPLAAIALVTACAHVPAPVPLTGPPDDLAALVGEWAGLYVYDGAGQRGGSILFRLDTVGDTARGDVLMSLPRQDAPPMLLPPEGESWSGTGPGVQLLSIRFVRTARGIVTGALEPYTDPACDCTLMTTFQGRVADHLIEGTFLARRADSEEVQRGRWKVDRRR